jgi:hypothetical protein
MYISTILMPQPRWLNLQVLAMKFLKEYHGNLVLLIHPFFSIIIKFFFSKGIILKIIDSYYLNGINNVRILNE